MMDSTFRQQSRSETVGREKEQRLLRQLLFAVEQQGGSSQEVDDLTTYTVPHGIFLTGDAGIGKTRLAHVISREAKSRRWSVIWNRGNAQESNIAYQLWVNVLQIAFTQDIWQPQEMGQQHYLSPSFRNLLPDLADLLPPNASHSTLEQVPLHIWESIRTALIFISEKTPLLIALDDIHRADIQSYDCLGYLLSHLNGFPLFIIGTYRKHEVTSSHPLSSIVVQLQRQHAIETLHLHPLTTGQIEALISSTPDMPPLTNPRLQQILADAAGNPFFAKELTWSQTSTLPRTIATFFDSLLGELSNECQQLLRNASVLGDSFELPVICLMTYERSIVADDDPLLDALDEALRHGILVESGSRNHITYHFRYPLLIKHLYKKIPIARRIRLHKRAVEALR